MIRVAKAGKTIGARMLRESDEVGVRCLRETFRYPATPVSATPQAATHPMRIWDRHCVDAVRVILGLETLYAGTTGSALKAR